jgi:hypothetical protein
VHAVVRKERFYARRTAVYRRCRPLAELGEAASMVSAICLRSFRASGALDVLELRDSASAWRCRDVIG